MTNYKQISKPHLNVLSLVFNSYEQYELMYNFLMLNETNGLLKKLAKIKLFSSDSEDTGGN